MHGLPEIPVIKYIALGPGPHCIKIHLVKRNWQLMLPWEKLTYMVQIAFDPEPDENFKTVLVEDNQYKLILPILPEEKRYLYVLPLKMQEDGAIGAVFIPLFHNKYLNRFPHFGIINIFLHKEIPVLKRLSKLISKYPR